MKRASAASPVEVLDLNRETLVLLWTDHDNFWADGLPALWISSPGMALCHITQDRPKTVDYRSAHDHIRFIGQPIAAFTRDNQRYTDDGPQTVSVEKCAAVVAFADSMLKSSEFTPGERDFTASQRATFQTAVDQGIVTDELKTQYLRAILFVIGSVAKAHPGPIPPPLPE